MHSYIPRQAGRLNAAESALSRPADMNGRTDTESFAECASPTRRRSLSKQVSTTERVMLHRAGRVGSVRLLVDYTELCVATASCQVKDELT
jgi:hypothetical protein